MSASPEPQGLQQGRLDPGRGSQPRLEASLCLVGEAAEGLVDRAAALRALAGRAVEQGYAAPSLVQAVLDREAAYPTGLPTALPVAIPHADAVHTLRPALAALVPERPVAFGEMGGRERTVEARLVLLLLVDDPTEQVGLLGRLIGLLQRPDLAEVLLDGLTSSQDLADRFNTLLTG